jgi:hypothetical protein
MSFHREFVAASKDDAAAVLDQDKVLPLAVKDFIRASIAHMGDNMGVYVKAQGHLWDGSSNSYILSNATIEVKPMEYTKPA